MTRTTIYTLAIVAAGVMLIAPNTFAKTVLVGTCMQNLQTYPTISQAVSAVPPGSTVLVCPGTYPEQVTITQALTLRGVHSGNAGNPTITVPVGGLTKSVTLGNGATMFFQVLAENTDSAEVNIGNLAIDGSNNGVTGISWLSAIFYRNSSGSIMRVATFNQSGNGHGFGIFLEPFTPSLKSVSIMHSSIRDYDAEGIRSIANSNPPSLTVSIRGNSVSPVVPTPQSGAGIDIDGVGTISGNRLISRQTSAGIGVTVLSDATISNNTIMGFGIGIWPIGDSVTITSNKISLATAGIVLSGKGNIVRHNSIFNSINGGAAIQLGCSATTHNTITHNVINDGFYGIINDNGTNIIMPNSFSNVVQLVSPPC
jgi:copper-binding protein NosD